jgi:hypothetical protein
MDSPKTGDGSALLKLPRSLGSGGNDRRQQQGTENLDHPTQWERLPSSEVQSLRD